MFTLRQVWGKARWTLLAIVVGMFATTTAVWWVEHGQEGSNIHTWPDAFWYALVTASTVGYGDTYPVSDAGRWIGGGYILVTLLFLATVLGNVQSAVVEATRLKELGMDGCKFDNHLLVCGWSQITEVAIAELLASGQKVAVIVQEESRVALVRAAAEKQDRLYVTVGDPSSEQTLARAGFRRASTLIVGTDDDTLNLITSINIRALHPTCRIIVYIQREELRATLQASGVTYVASPFELSGRLVASAAFEPEVALLVDEVSSSQGGFDLQQFMVTADSHVVGSEVKGVREKLLAASGPLLVAIARRGQDGAYELVANPSGSTKLSVHDALIVLGDDDQNDVASQLLGCAQGR